MGLKEVIEEMAAEFNYIVIPLYKAHPQSGRPLFRLSDPSKSVGMSFYILDDVIYGQVKDEWQPMTVKTLLEQ